MKKILLFALLLGACLPAFSQIDIRSYQHGAYLSLDTFVITIDDNDNSGVGSTNMIAYFNVYNISPTFSEAFYLEAEWLCSNSSAYFQFCQNYPPDYTTGTCHPFQKDGLRIYDGYNYTVPPDTCGYNYLACHLWIYDYSVEKEHEKVCRFRARRRNTHEILDSMYLIIRRGNLPCYMSQPTSGIRTPSAAEEIADIYPNPARSSFTIAAKQDLLTSCSLYSPLGALVYDKRMVNGQRISIDVADLPDGVYYLKLTDKRKRSFYRKITVEH